MPFINTKTNVKISSEKEQAIKDELAKAITAIPGKSESWLMVGFEDEYHLYFKGNSDKPLAFVEVKIYGSASSAAYEKLTGMITSILGEELGISADCVYVKYEEVEYWGWNGANF